MATLDEMLKAGYKPAQTPAQQIMELVNNTQQSAVAQAKKRQEDAGEQAKLYNSLREAGYSQQDATDRVNRTFRSTSFIESIVNGERDTFAQPTGVDKSALEQQKANTETTRIQNEVRKTEADIPKIEADTRLANAKSTYYEAGGPKRSVIDKMTPNQLQQRLKYLQSIEDLGDTDEENQAVASEIKYINDKIQGISGYKNTQTDEEPSKSEKVIMTGPDGKKYKIPAANVEKAKARGFK